MSAPQVRIATRQDTESIRLLLEHNGLPTSDLTSSEPQFIVACEGKAIVAAGAIVAYAGLSSRAEWLPAWEDGLAGAVDAIDSGAAEQLLARWVRFGQQL